MMTMVRKLAALTTAWSASARAWTPEINCRTRGHRHRVVAARAPGRRRPRLRQTPGIDEIGKPLIFKPHSKPSWRRVQILSAVRALSARAARLDAFAQDSAKPLDQAHVHDNPKGARSRLDNRDNGPAN